MTGNSIRNRGAWALANLLKTNKVLKKIFCKNYYLIIFMLFLKSIKELILCNNIITEDGAGYFADSLRINKVNSIYISN